MNRVVVTTGVTANHVTLTITFSINLLILTITMTSPFIFFFPGGGGGVEGRKAESKLNFRKAGSFRACKQNSSL